MISNLLRIEYFNKAVEIGAKIVMNIRGTTCFLLIFDNAISVLQVQFPM